VGVRVFMAALTAAALLEGGVSAHAVEAANSALLYPAPDSNFANSASGDNTLVSIAALSRFTQIDNQGVLLAVQNSSLLRGQDVEAAMPFARNLVVEFGARSGNAFDLAPDTLFTNPAEWEPFSATGREMHAQGAVALGKDLALNFGESLGESDSLLPSFGPSWMMTPLAGGDRARGFAETGFAGLSWNPTPWASLGLIARQASAQGPASIVQSGFSPAKVSAQTLGAVGKVTFGRGWVTSFSYNRGTTQLDLSPAGNLVAADGAKTAGSYGVAIAKHGLFDDSDALGLAVSRPSLPSLGGVSLADADSVDPFDGFISSATRPIMSGSTQETDLQLGYVTTFLDGALALQANAGYQMNTAGQQGNNGVAVLSRAKINF
jgi:hypothetical protein